MAIQVYNAIMVARLTHGLSTVRLTLAMLNRLDAFQLRGLRYILKTDISYYFRISNREIYDRINIFLNKGTDINITCQEFMAAHHSDKPEQIGLNSVNTP